MLIWTVIVTTTLAPLVGFTGDPKQARYECEHYAAYARVQYMLPAKCILQVKI